MATDAKTIGLYNPRMSTKPSKPMNKAYLKKKLKNASAPTDQTSCRHTPSAWLKCFSDSSKTQYSLF